MNEQSPINLDAVAASERRQLGNDVELLQGQAKILLEAELSNYPTDLANTLVTQVYPQLDNKLNAHYERYPSAVDFNAKVAAVGLTNEHHLLRRLVEDVDRKSKISRILETFEKVQGLTSHDVLKRAVEEIHQLELLIKEKNLLGTLDDRDYEYYCTKQGEMWDYVAKQAPDLTQAAV